MPNTSTHTSIVNPCPAWAQDTLEKMTTSEAGKIVQLTVIRYHVVSMLSFVVLTPCCTSVVDEGEREAGPLGGRAANCVFIEYQVCLLYRVREGTSYFVFRASSLVSHADTHTTMQARDSRQFSGARR